MIYNYAFLCKSEKVLIIWILRKILANTPRLLVIALIYTDLLRFLIFGRFVCKNGLHFAAYHHIIL